MLLSLRACAAFALAADCACFHACAQLTVTIPLGRSHSLGAGHHQLLFKPALSKARIIVEGAATAMLLPDVPGEYVAAADDGAGTTQYIQAVDLAKWAADALPIMRDDFGANISPADSASGQNFWAVEAQPEGCSLQEEAGTGLHLEMAGGGEGPCGLRTRDGCPAHLGDASVTGRHGPATLSFVLMNPF
jgi:hypothetical protein